MKIVIVGVGEIGTYLAEVLLQEKHDLILVEKDENKVRQTQERLDAQIIAGDGTNPLVLEPLVDEQTDIFIAVTDHDAVNVISTLIARKYGVRRAIARITEATNLIHPLLTDDPKVSVLNAEMIVSKDLARLVGNPNAEDIEYFAQGKAEMIRLHVGKEADIAHRKLKEIDVPSSWIMVARIRNGDFSIVSGETMLQPGDQVLVAGDPKKSKEIENFLGLEQAKVRRVILVGYNEISEKLAVALTKRNIDVRLIEENREKAEKASGVLDKVLVIQGDGTSEETLEQAGIDQTDYLVALTQDDETNVLISLLAKEKKVNRVIALALKPQYKPIIEKIGVDTVLNPRAAMVDEIVRNIHHQEVSGVSIFEGVAGRMVEVIVKKKTKLVDKPLSQVKMPKQILIGAIIRDSKLIIPRGDSRIQVGDHILVFTTSRVLEEVKRLFM